MRIIFTGSGEFGVPTLAALLDAGHTIFPYTQPSRPAGRGRKVTPTPVAQFAMSRGVTPIETGDINSENLPEADAMIVIAFGQKIGPAAVNHPRLGSMNLHASLLPKYRGAAPINWAILHGETQSGNSVIRLAAKMDAGAILGQSASTIGDIETAGELHDRLAVEGVALILQVLGELESGRAVERPQDDSQATLAPKLSRQSTLLDWNRPAAEIARKIRGLYPWPGCRVELRDAAGGGVDRLTLARARVAEGEGPRWNPGEVSIHGHVAAGDDCVEILEVQPDGKRAMPLADYRRGNLWMPGMKLASI